MPANFLYFATFEYLVRSLQSGRDTRVHQVPSYAIAMAGGIAGGELPLFHLQTPLIWRCPGMANWSLVFPVDVIKSRYQTDSLSRPRYGSILDCLRQTLGEGGSRALWRGYSACMMRAFIANAATFVAVEGTQRLLCATTPYIQ